MHPGGELHGLAVPRPKIVHVCDDPRMESTGKYCRRPHLDEVIDWAGKPTWHMHALETGAHTSRSVSVRELQLWVVETHDVIDPLKLNPFQTEVEALAAAEAALRVPDSRGIYRRWVPEGERPRGTLMAPGGSFDRDPKRTSENQAREE